MPVQHVSNLAAYRQALKAGKPTIVDFWAAWCGPCKMMKPKFEALAQAHPSIQCLSVDVDECGDVAQAESISAMPTFIVYDANGNQIKTIVGADLRSLTDMFTRLA